MYQSWGSIVVRSVGNQVGGRLVRAIARIGVGEPKLMQDVAVLVRELALLDLSEHLGQQRALR